MPVGHVHHHEPDADGSYATDIITTISHADRQALGQWQPSDAGEATHALVWALIFLATLERDGRYHDETEDDLAALRGIIGTLDRRIIPALQGVRDAAVRRHHALGGSYGRLADAMNVPRSTAQTRCDALLEREPSPWEQWAVDGRSRMPWADIGSAGFADDRQREESSDAR